MVAMPNNLTGIINDNGFSEHRWGVFGVSKFGVEVQFEVGIIVHLLVTQPEDLSALCSFYVLLQDIVNHGINILIHILKKEWEAIFNGYL